MTIKKITHTGVKRDGTFRNKQGAVITEGAIRMSKGEGCGLEGCHCSDGYWLTIISPRTTKGIVEALNVTFDSMEEMNEFLECHELTASNTVTELNPTYEHQLKPQNNEYR